MDVQHEPVPTSAPAGMTHDNPDYEYAFTPTGSGYEHTDANVWVLVKFGIWLVVSALVIHAGLLLVFDLAVKQREASTEAEFPLAATSSGPRLPAEPRLQRSPANEMYEFQLKETAAITSYGWVDRNAGTVRIPIAQAMRLTLERGLPVRGAAVGSAAVAATGEAPPDAPAATPALTPVDPSLFPADSSGGRTSERRR